MKTYLTSGFLLTILCAALACAKQPPANKKHSIPDGASIAEGKKLIAEVYRDHYVKATTPALKQALAKKLVEDGTKTNDDRAAQYSLFLVARRIAMEIGDVDLAMQTVELTSKSFDVDVGAMQQEVIEDIAPQVKTPEDHYSLARHIGRLLPPHLQADRYEAAGKQIASALEAAKKSKHADLLKQWTRRANEVAANEMAFVATKAARETLEQQPADKAANAIVGKYACFVKNDWEKGLAMLALGDDADLQKLAEQDLKGANNAAEQLALADAWHAVAQKREAAEQTALLQRARTLYQRALPGLSALPKRRVENRLQEIRAATSPFVKGEWTQILDYVDPARHATNTAIRRSGNSIVIEEHRDHGYFTIPVTATGNFEIRVRATRPSDKEDGISVRLPGLGNGVLYVLNGYSGTASGLSFLDGKDMNENKSKVPGTPQRAGVPYELHVRVEASGDKRTISTMLNARPHSRWTGPVTSLTSSPQVPWHDAQFGICTWWRRLEIESIEIKAIDGAAYLTE
jgi:hypothetical protein